MCHSLLVPNVEECHASRSFDVGPPFSEVHLVLLCSCTLQWAMRHRPEVAVQHAAVARPDVTTVQKRLAAGFVVVAFPRSLSPIAEPGNLEDLMTVPETLAARKLLRQSLAPVFESHRLLDSLAEPVWMQ